LSGGSGDDVELGGKGDDDITETGGGGTIDGGEGSDSISCGTGAVTVSSDSHDHESEDCQGAGHDLQSYKGTVTAVDSTSITVQWSHVNDTAQTWLTANGSPNPVKIGLATTTRVETEGSATIQTGDRVEVEANTGTDLTTLVAAVVQAEH
jgi:hypothetical protein